MQDENIALFCIDCGTRLTEWLSAIRTPADARAKCDLKCPAGSAPVPKGLALLMEGEVLEDYLTTLHNPPAEASPESWVNLDDVLSTVLHTKNCTRLSGCCGLDGVDGPNRVCGCGAEVGTERSDCWTWQVFVANLASTEWKNDADS